MQSGAQVTFSKDWNPGKRISESSDIHTTMKSATTICHILLVHKCYFTNFFVININIAESNSTVGSM